MRLYHFSPIKNQKQFLLAVKYIATSNTKLCKSVIGKKLPINSLTIFSHYPKEFEQLTKYLYKLGKRYNENNGLRVRLNKPINVGSNVITYLRVRKPDPYRMQVGCNDFIVENYKVFKNTYLKAQAKNLRLIKRQEYEMIEFFDPEFDVLAYVVNG